MPLLSIAHAALDPESFAPDARSDEVVGVVGDEQLSTRLDVQPLGSDRRGDNGDPMRECLEDLDPSATTEPQRNCDEIRQLERVLDRCLKEPEELGPFEL